MHNQIKKQDIRKLTREQLAGFFRKSGKSSFKGKQVWEWLWKKHVLDFDDMTNISLNERNLLKENFLVKHTNIKDYLVSKDQTIKAAFLLYDGQSVEGVLIPVGGRITACISSQAGCSYSCVFCATGQMGFIRNLGYAEIYDQVVRLTSLSVEKYNKGLSNIVFMGMGEPLANYSNVISAVNLICHKNALSMSPSRITLSTAGIVKGINKLAQDKVKFNLAVSLHSAENDKRSRLMPLNKKNNLQDLASSLKNFYRATNKRITIEYLLIDNFNDSPDDATALAKYCKQFPAKINIIEYNPVKNKPFNKPSKNKIEMFIKTLEKFNLIINIRKSRGSDVNAACGQLAIQGLFNSEQIITSNE